LIEPASTGFFEKKKKEEEDMSKDTENKKIHKKENLAYLNVFCEVLTIFVYQSAVF
jgi:hypothetical protein